MVGLALASLLLAVPSDGAVAIRVADASAGCCWCGTVFLAQDDDRAFIETAKAGSGPHWFDQLDLSFHPNASLPTYGLVQAGRVTVRQMPRPSP